MGLSESHGQAGDRVPQVGYDLYSHAAPRIRLSDVCESV